MVGNALHALCFHGSPHFILFLGCPGVGPRSLTTGELHGNSSYSYIHCVVLGGMQKKGKPQRKFKDTNWQAFAKDAFRELQQFGTPLENADEMTFLRERKSDDYRSILNQLIPR